MKKTSFFTLHPAPPYFTFPFHLRQSSMSFLSSSVPTEVQAAEIVKGFHDHLIKLLEIPEDYHLVIFNSDRELKTVLADTYFSNKSFHPVHGANGMNYYKILNIRRHNAIEIPIIENDKEFNIITIPDGMPVCIIANEPDTGSITGTDFLNKISSRPRHNFVHVDLTSLVPGIRINPGNLQSFSFAFNTSFGIPLNNAAWIVSPPVFAEFMLKFEDRYPGDEFTRIASKCYYYGSPDYLFMEVAQKVIEDFRNKGLKNILNETIYKSKILEKAAAANKAFHHLIRDEKFRSMTTIVLEYLGRYNHMTETLIKYGVEVDNLMSPTGQQRIRITNFPVHSKEQFEMLSDVIANIE